MFTTTVDAADRVMALLLGIVLMGTSGGAMAQTPDAGMGPEIVVEAPRSVPIPAERSPYSGAPIVITTVKIPALYGDLNLAKPADAERLMTRINRVARDACKQLDRLYPFNPDPDCVRRAVASATVAAKSVIAAAGK
jgi:UrcA family protein